MMMLISLVNRNLSYMMMFMKSDADWTAQVKGLLKGELKRRNVSYDGLVERLKAIGIEETAENIANKISRGKFTAVWLMQCMEAIGSRALRFDE